MESSTLELDPGVGGLHSLLFFCFLFREFPANEANKT